MSLSDQFKNSFEDIKKKKSSKENEAEISDNILSALSKLSEDLVKEVKSGDIKIYDTKDIRDLASIYTMLKQVNDTGDSKDTPELPKNKVSYLVGKLGIEMTSKDDNDVDVSDKLEHLTEDDVTTLLDSQEDVKNDENVGNDK